MPSWLARTAAIGALALVFTAAPEQVAHAGPCGIIGFPCCSPDDPPPCRQGVCLPEPDSNDTLSGGGAGVDFTCQPCGGDGQFCCDKEKCNSGFTCLSECDERGAGQGSGAWDCEALDGQGSGAGAASTCEPCGELGEQCCDESTCIGDNLICGSEFCEACGAIGEQCCANDTCPGAAGLCINGTCAPPPAPVMGNAGVLVLILLLSSVAWLGIRRVASS